MCYLGVSYEEARRLPIQYRTWFVKRMQQEINQQREAPDYDLQTAPAYMNTPANRALQGMPPGRRKF